MSERPYNIFFKTLANNNRLKIINLLKKEEKCVTDICKELKFNQTTVSHNLKRLSRCGFVFFKQNGKQRYYYLNKKKIKPLIELIDKHMQEYCEKIIKGER